MLVRICQTIIKTAVVNPLGSSRTGQSMWLCYTRRLRWFNKSVEQAERDPSMMYRTSLKTCENDGLQWMAKTKQ